MEDNSSKDSAPKKIDDVDGDGNGDKPTSETVEAPSPKEVERSSGSCTPVVEDLNDKGDLPNGDGEEEAAIVENNISEQVTGNGESGAGNDPPEIQAEPPARNEEAVEMDPLVLTGDEPDPELQFDDSDDLDSRKSSPTVPIRCETRRSLALQVPVPRTPGSATPTGTSTPTRPTTTPPRLITTENQNSESSDGDDDDDDSTNATAGSDMTRMNFTISSPRREGGMELNPILGMLYSSQRLTPRPTIRPLNDSYRRHRSCDELQAGPSSRGPMASFSGQEESQSSASAEMLDRNKRSRHSPSPEDRKRFRAVPPEGAQVGGVEEAGDQGSGGIIGFITRRFSSGPHRLRVSSDDEGREPDEQQRPQQDEGREPGEQQQPQQDEEGAAARAVAAAREKKNDCTIL